MSKMSLNDPFGHLKHKLWQKKGKESKCQFYSRPLKVRNLLDFFLCRWHATYHWKALDESYNSSQSEVCTQSFTTPKSQESQLWECWDSHLGVPGQNAILDVGFMERHKVYYKGEGGGLPQVWAMVNLMSPSLPVARPNNKNVPTMH